MGWLALVCRLYLVYNRITQDIPRGKLPQRHEHKVNDSNCVEAMVRTMVGMVDSRVTVVHSRTYHDSTTVTMVRTRLIMVTVRATNAKVERIFNCARRRSSSF